MVPAETPRMIQAADSGAPSSAFSLEKRGAGGASRLILVVGGILAAVNLFVLGMAWVTVAQGRRQAEAQSKVNASNLAQVLERNLEGDIRSIDLALFSVKRELALERAAGAPRPGQLDAYIQDLFTHYPSLDSLRTANAAGEIDHGIGVAPGPRASVADRDYFLKLKGDPAAGLVISKPVLGRISGKWVIVLARRIDGPEGSFGGVVYGVITLDGFTRALATVDPGSQGSVVMRDGDLGLVARYPYAKGISDRIGDRQITPAFQALWQSGQTRGTYITRAALDGVERTLSFRKVGSYPLWVNVGLASSDYLAQWRRDATRTWLLSGLFCVLTTLLGALQLRSWSRERQRRILELDRALEEVKALRGLLPICAHCKKIRDDQGSWTQIEGYIQARSQAQFTHGICPDCARENYPEVFERREQSRG